MNKMSQLWACIKIEVHPNTKELDDYGSWRSNYRHGHLIRRWDYPKWIIDRHSWYFNWVLALVQCRFPKHYIGRVYCGYYPETQEKLSSKRQHEISEAQGQITKIKNVLKHYQEEKQKTLFSDLSNDPIYRKLQEKLEMKEFNLQQAIMMPIEETL